VTSKLITKFRALGLNPSLCNWVLDFLTGYPHVVKVGNNNSTTLILNTEAPQRCLPSPLLYCTLITNNDKTANREEVRALSININKTKELFVDYRRQQREHAPIHMGRATVQRVISFKFLTEDLKWSPHTDSMVKKAQQHFNLRRLQKLLQMYHQEHTVWVYYRLVSQLYRPQPHGSPEGDTASPTHHRGNSACPPGHLQHPVSQEDQGDHPGHQPAEPRPVHPATI
jgi:hypothetical protein